MIRFRIELCLAVVFLVFAAGACGHRVEKAGGIVLITLDTTRADHLGCYGDAAAATPNLDALAKEAVRFDEAMTAVPTTLPSHSTMFTGVYPPVHGVRYNGMFKLSPKSVTIAHRLHDAGFVTGAVPASYPVFAKSGLDQGFDTYRDLFSEKGNEHLPPNSERKAADVTRLGLETIPKDATKPFFVWLHYYDAHYPYEPPFPYSARFHDHPYDGEIAYVDAQLGDLFRELRARGLWDRIAIIVAGDHGEGLYDHGEKMHSQLTYQTTLHVPLLIKAPGAKHGAVIREPVSLADIAPTVLDLAGLPVPPDLDGISLRAALSGIEPPRRALYFETLAGALNFGWSPLEGLRRGKWKLIRSTDPELYDLDADPAEATNVSTSEAAIASDLGTTLEQGIARWTSSAVPAQTTAAPIDPGALAQLASLGYIGGNVTEAHRGGPSPRRMVHLEGELLLLQDLMAQRLFRQAVDSAASVLRDDPGNRFALNAAADGSVGLRDFEGARRYGHELLTRYPDYVPGYVTQGRLEVALKNYAAAEKFFRAGLEKNAGEPVLVYSLALALIAEHRAADARPLLDEALRANARNAYFLVARALCRAIEHDPAGAKADLTAAMEAGYNDRETLTTEPMLEPLRKIPGFNEALSAKKAG